ncbi:MAG: macrolide transporter ATP-binding protein [Paenibacillus sp.]|jgi:putative ABC transport system ATP-binding protein|nr:macrolide transporter ATP-binding protein [Paenibacillus sp.]
MIRANQLTHTFGKESTLLYALKEVNLSISHGEMVSIIGPSGCGKTTLLQILSGIETPTSGEVYIDGFNLHEANEKKRDAFRLNHMGFIFQMYHLVPVLTAVENVALPLIGQGVSTKTANQRARAALAQVGLADKHEAYPAMMSGGQNQRTAIARAIVAEPKVIWADEPTGALDSQTSQQIIGLLRHINETMNTTIVMVTHDSQMAAQTDRIIRMENGRITESVMTGNSLDNQSNFRVRP